MSFPVSDNPCVATQKHVSVKDRVGRYVMFAGVAYWVTPHYYIY